MSNPHALVVPFPAQGHVIPLMKLSQCLAATGFKITFVNTEFIHALITGALPERDNNQNQIRLVSIPDGMELGEDRRNQVSKVLNSIRNTMPGHLGKLIQEINKSADDIITCIIADECVGWAVQIAKKMGIPSVAFCPASAGTRALILHIPRLIEDGIIDANGTCSKQKMIQLSPTMPTMSRAHLPWEGLDEELRQIFFHLFYENSKAIRDADWFLCNSFYDCEPSAHALNPNLLPIGPLLPGSWLGQPVGHFWPEDSTCLRWLDEQPHCSVIYVAFGSITAFDQHQLHELALGLELAGRPFLWVVRPGLTNAPAASSTYPDGFEARVADRGRMVSWAPQQKVLAHPSIACFLTHCGWNSTMEGLSMGVPFLCWPQFTDQFLNQNYISDVWKVGLQLNSKDNGIISRDEIKEKVKELVGNEKIRGRALELKELARKSVSEGGSSVKNFNYFVEAMIRSEKRIPKDRDRWNHSFENQTGN